MLIRRFQHDGKAQLHEQRDYVSTLLHIRANVIGPSKDRAMSHEMQKEAELLLLKSPDCLCRRLVGSATLNFEARFLPSSFTIKFTDKFRIILL